MNMKTYQARTDEQMKASERYYQKAMDRLLTRIEANHASIVRDR